MAPARVVFTVELEGGADAESLHCLRLEWSWGDGTSSSAAAGDCAKFVPGETKVQRLFQADHEYREGGRFSVEVKVLKEERLIGRDSIGVTIGPRPTRPGFEYRER